MTDAPRRGLHVEPARDPELGEAIRRAEGPPASDARLELLRARIAAAAAVALRGRRELAWWEWTARWARAEVALSVAACIVAMVVAYSARVGVNETPADSLRGATVTSARGNAGVDTVVASAVASGASAEQVLTAIVGPLNDAEWLFQAAAARLPDAAPLGDSRR